MGYDGKKVLEFLSQTHDTSLLTEREKHLIGLGVTMTRGCQVCTRGRIEKARVAGIEDDVLNALVGVVSAVNAGVAAATAREGFRLADAASADACGAVSAPRKLCRVIKSDRQREGEKMKGVPKVGTTGEQRFVVELQHAIDFADSVMPAVLSTPWLVWFLEHAARAAVLPLLEPGESTVGVEVQVQHLAPTPVGETVTCRARVLFAEKNLVSFQLEAFDGHEQIARGLHRRRVIRVDRSAQRVREKTMPK